MSYDLLSYAMVERYVPDLLRPKFPQVKYWGKALPTNLGGITPLVLVSKVTGERTLLMDYPVIDIETIADDYPSAVSLAEGIDSFLLGYHGRVESGGRATIIDSVDVDDPPVERPLEDGSAARRMLATYTLSVRR